MAKFYGGLRPEGKTEVTRTSNKNQPIRSYLSNGDSELTSYMGFDTGVDAVFAEAHFEIDLFKRVTVRYSRDANGEIVVGPCLDFMKAIPDDRWAALFENREFGARLRGLLITHLDAIQKG